MVKRINISLSRRTIVSFFYIILLSLIGVSCFFSCTTLDKRVKGKEWADWFVLHEPLMHTKVPKWIDARNLTEREHFLRLPDKLQIEYIKMFWKIRFPGLDEVFYSRLAYVRQYFTDMQNPWHSQMGRVFLLLGEPMYRYYYRNGIQALEDSMPESGDIQVWAYYTHGGTASYIFVYQGVMWYADLSNTRAHGAQVMIEEYARREFAPTSIGWDEWADVLYQYLY